MLKITEKVTSIDHGADFILKQLKELGDGASITTGIQAEDFDKTQTLRGRSRGEVPVGEYAAMQEFGTQKSPARPFMQKTLDMNITTFVNQTQAGMRSIYNGNLTIESLLNRQARRQEKAMKKTIKTWNQPGIHPLTVRTKLRLNRRPEPLQETRTMLNSIKSKVRKKGGGLNPGLKALLKAADLKTMKRGLFG